MKNILILGASGTIGNGLYKILSPYYNVYGTYFNNKDIRNKKKIFFDSSTTQLQSILKITKPKLIINALKGERLDLINVQRNTVDYCMKKDCRLMFISGVKKDCGNLLNNSLLEIASLDNNSIILAPV